MQNEEYMSNVAILDCVVVVNLAVVDVIVVVVIALAILLLPWVPVIRLGIDTVAARLVVKTRVRVCAQR